MAKGSEFAKFYMLDGSTSVDFYVLGAPVEVQTMLDIWNDGNADFVGFDTYEEGMLSNPRIYSKEDTDEWTASLAGYATTKEPM